MVLRSSLPFLSAGVCFPEAQSLRTRITSIGCFSGSGGGGGDSAGATRRGNLTAAGVVRMSAAAADGQSPSGIKNDENATKSVMVRIRGKVQGVFYRNWTVESAKQLGVNGWVRNNKDGTVEAVFSGKPTDVDTLLEKCHVGPPAAKVSNIEVIPHKETVGEGFERRPTIW